MRGQLELERLTKTFAGGAGASDISFKISAGEGFSLLGPSGCGKTTTLRMIGGFEMPDQGKISLNGKEITRAKPQERDLRTVFQRYALFPHLCVSDNVAFGLRVKGFSGSELNKRVADALEMMEITRLAGRRILQLSGGEQQRVALARAIVTEPSLLLLDEPLSALDLKLRERMQLELLSLRRKLGMTFVMVTHDQTEAMVVADRLAVMNHGRIEQLGSPEELYERPKTRFVAGFLGQANFIDAPQKALLQGNGQVSDKSLMIRPERSLLLKEMNSELNGLKIRVAEQAFLGQHRLIKVEDKSGAFHLIKAPAHESVNLGEEAWMAWKRSDAWPVDVAPG